MYHSILAQKLSNHVSDSPRRCNEVEVIAFAVICTSFIETNARKSQPDERVLRCKYSAGAKNRTGELKPSYIPNTCCILTVFLASVECIHPSDHAHFYILLI